MARFAFRRSRAFSVTTLLLALLLPSVASAGWGDEEWGRMVWGGVGVYLPSLSIEGLIALATVLVFVSGALLARRHRGTRP
ncbi:MAG: hypothetical protein JRS35_29065 [Deltaproteobacteria bacterium]|nr:hypothetical protein [Deltaproteobacteria bacterium]